VAASKPLGGAPTQEYLPNRALEPTAHVEESMNALRLSASR